jgi:hypothetical protein
MKINLIPTTKLALLCTAVCAAMFAFSQNAGATNTQLTVGDGNTLGYVYFGIPSGDQDRQTYTNDLVGFYNSGCVGDCGMANGQSYFIVNPSPTFGTTLPNATFVTNGTNATGIQVLTGYTYLFAKYDGPNAGSVVWYIGNLVGQTIDIPATWNGYGLSGWTIFSGGGGVPDGGTTVMLLGAALGALGMARRFLKR